jgi:hypothetical protein
MNETLAPVLRKSAIIFFDDILVYSKTFEEHLIHLQQVLQLLATHQWKVKLSKCLFVQHSIACLGYVVSAQGVSTDPSKIVDIQQWPVPTILKELRGFLGISGYYRKFVRQYGVISQPLMHLLRKGVPLSGRLPLSKPLRC